MPNRLPIALLALLPWFQAPPAAPTSGTAAPPGHRAVRYRVDVAAPIESVWSAWTEPERVREWFARGAEIELEPLGRYEILFAPDAPAGSRGAEGNLVLAVQAPELVSFTWDAPPRFPEARRQRTTVVIRLEALADGATRVWLEQTGWGRGGQWDETFEYFTSAWKSVLALLARRFAEGPTDWSRAPDAEALARHAAAVSSW
jgi:uncharacterized protein YndB with AHSA1/START domain